MKVARAHENNVEVNPKLFIGYIYRINRSSTNNRYSSNVLNKEEIQC